MSVATLEPITSTIEDTGNGEGLYMLCVTILKSGESMRDGPFPLAEAQELQRLVTLYCRARKALVAEWLEPVEVY